jgi:hypothetical protein
MGRTPTATSGPGGGKAGNGGPSHRHRARRVSHHAAWTVFQPFHLHTKRTGNGQALNRKAVREYGTPRLVPFCNDLFQLDQIISFGVAECRHDRYAHRMFFKQALRSVFMKVLQAHQARRTR